ncbi:MAG: class I SAM-dependent methyltransferase [Actinobacteria bacterium]|nr:MAG: class I SAM-dependent methyltransferase [Actinomycetota bacterium]
MVPQGAPVLDLACGGGRHTRLFAEAGHPVTAVDIDLGNLGDLAGHPRVEPIQADLEGGDPFFLRGPLPGRTFGGVVVTNYLHRPLLEDLVAAVAPGGVLIYETFAEGNETLGGRVTNPEPPFSGSAPSPSRPRPGKNGAYARDFYLTSVS